jgi:hypothetical protein
MQYPNNGAMVMLDFRSMQYTTLRVKPAFVVPQGKGGGGYDVKTLTAPLCRRML